MRYEEEQFFRERDGTCGEAVGKKEERGSDQQGAGEFLDNTVQMEVQVQWDRGVLTLAIEREKGYVIVKDTDNGTKLANNKNDIKNLTGKMKRQALRINFVYMDSHSVLFRLLMNAWDLWEYLESY